MDWQYIDVDSLISQKSALSRAIIQRARPSFPFSGSVLASILGFKRAGQRSVSLSIKSQSQHLWPNCGWSLSQQLQVVLVLPSRKFLDKVSVSTHFAQSQLVSVSTSLKIILSMSLTSSLSLTFVMITMSMVSLACIVILTSLVGLIVSFTCPLISTSTVSLMLSVSPLLWASHLLINISPILVPVLQYHYWMLPVWVSVSKG